MATVRKAYGIGSATNVAIVSWLAPTAAYDAIRIVWRTDGDFPANATDGQDINGASWHDCTPTERTEGVFEHTNLVSLAGTQVSYTVFAGNGGSWGVVDQDNSYAQATITQLGPVQVQGTVLDSSSNPIVGAKVFISRTTPSTFELWTGASAAANFATTDVAGYFDFTNYFTHTDGVNDTFWAGNNLHIIVKDSSNVVLFEVDHVVTKREISAYGGPLLDAGTALTLAPPVIVNVMPVAPVIAGVEFNPTPVTVITPSFIWNHSPDTDNLYNAGKVDYAIEYGKDTLPVTPAPHSPAVGENVASNAHAYFLAKTLTPAHLSCFSYREKVIGAPSWGSTWTPFPSTGGASTGYKVTDGSEAQIKFTVPASGDLGPLEEATWSWRVYVTDKTPE